MKKIAKLFLASVAVLTLAACGEAGTGSSASNEEKSDDQLSKIKEAGLLKVGTSADFAPFEFRQMIDGKDTIVGADIDMANEIGSALGVEVEFVNMDFDTVLASLQQGSIDVAISGISATPERQESFDFSINYYNPPQVVVINQGQKDNLTSVEALAGKKVGAQKGTIQEDVVKEQLAESQLVSITKVPNLIVELNQGSLDALVLEKTIAEAYISQNPDLMLAEIPLTSSEDEAYAIAMPKDSPVLKAEIDSILENLIDEGKIEDFVDKNTLLMNQAEE